MTLRPPRHRWLAFGLLAVSSAQAQVFTLTEDSGGTDRVALGYPVPIPADTQTAFDGFRSYAALDARLSDLSLLSADIRADVLGQTRAERGIPVYLLGDADTSTAEGFAESAALINGGIHAREWASPEVVVNLIETMAAQAD